MKELDVLVERHYRRRYAQAAAPQKAAFVRMLDQVEDPEIWAWVMGHKEPPIEYADVIAELRRHD